MLQEERFLRIRTLLSTLSRVSTERIAQDLDVSRETVRRDILALESQGILRRVHGGVVAQGPEPEPPLAVRQAVREREKRAIARAALQLLQPGQTLFIDAGSTTTLLAEALSSLSGLTIITNGLNVALKLAAADADPARWPHRPCRAGHARRHHRGRNPPLPRRCGPALARGHQRAQRRHQL